MFYHLHLAQYVPHPPCFSSDWMHWILGPVLSDCQGFQHDWGARHQVRLFFEETDRTAKSIAIGEQFRPWSVPGWMSSGCSFSDALRARFFHIFFSMMQRMTELIPHIVLIWAVFRIPIGCVAYAILLPPIKGIVIIHPRSLPWFSTGVRCW
jgi:hypothetical protein